jgi:hypothetical protein
VPFRGAQSLEPAPLLNFFVRHAWVTWDQQEGWDMEREQAIAALKRLQALASFDPPEPRSVTLIGRQITDADLEPLAAFPGLEFVEFRFAGVTGPGLEHLRGLSRLQTLILDTTPVTDAGLACLADLKGLVSLDLAYCGQVTDAGVAHLTGLTRLRGLKLCDTQVTDAGLASLEGLTDLEELDLHLTSITDAGLAHLRRLARLRELNLGYTHLTDAGLEYLKGLTGLTELNLENTEVSHAGVEGLRRCLPRVSVIYGPESAPVRVG